MTSSPIPGSHRHPVPGARRVGSADPAAAVRVTLVLRRAAPRAGAPADPADLALVEDFVQAHGLTVTHVSQAARAVGLLGTVAEMQVAFGVELSDYAFDGQTYRGRVGEVHVPPDLAGAVVAVLGLDDRPQAAAHFRFAPSSATSGYDPREVGKRYGFPTDADGTGQTVAVIELGGGYRPADLTTYFQGLGLKTPKVTAVSVDGARNSPGEDADGEVMLDIEVIGALAPAASILVYFAPNTTNGFYDAVAAALHDTARKPSVVSISWGQAESGWTAAAMDSYDALFADAATLGITIYAAAGDGGAADGASVPSRLVAPARPGRRESAYSKSGLNADFPASSPHVVGCGGTKLTDADEVVWNENASGNGATGGGVSVHFGLPGYQSAAKVPVRADGKPGRGVPDVAGNADPLTGYQVRVNGQDVVIGGTSAVAPLWAGLTLLANQSNHGPAGAPHDRLYASPAAFTDITSGDNDGYEAAPGWDACTGLGTPKGPNIVQALGPT